MKTFVFDFEYETVTVHPSRAAAEKFAKDFGIRSPTIAATVDDLRKDNVNMDMACRFYNRFYPSTFNYYKKGFASIEVAYKSLLALAAAKTQLVKQPKEKKVTEVKETTRGRKTAFAGLRLKTADNTKNNRRPNSFGYRSFAIILDSMPDGILYEDYIAAGGRRVDLAWDLEKGTILVSKS